MGESVEGKQVLGELGNKMLHSIDCMERLMTDGPTEMRIRAMNAFASLVRLEKENQSQELLSLTESWFRRIPKAMFLTVNVVKQPFLDLRLAAYQAGFRLFLLLIRFYSEFSSSYSRSWLSSLGEGKKY